MGRKRHQTTFKNADALSAKSTVAVSFHTAIKTPESPACLGFFVPAIKSSADPMLQPLR
jgi:hypothetical protein